MTKLEDNIEACMYASYQLKKFRKRMRETTLTAGGDIPNQSPVATFREDDAIA